MLLARFVAGAGRVIRDSSDVLFLLILILFMFHCVLIAFLLFCSGSGLYFYVLFFYYFLDFFLLSCFGVKFVAVVFLGDGSVRFVELL